MDNIHKIKDEKLEFFFGGVFAVETLILIGVHLGWYTLIILSVLGILDYFFEEKVWFWCLQAIVINLSLPEPYLEIMALGLGGALLLNKTAVIANGGKMPVNYVAYLRSNISTPIEDSDKHRPMNSETKFYYLCDILTIKKL